MLNSFSIAAAVGTILGFLAGLGVGGGSLLMLWLTIVINIPQSTARSINLLFFIPTALISCVFRKKQGSIQYKKILPAILAGIAAAAISGSLSSQLDIALLQKLFGALLILTGLRELFYRPRKAR